MNQNALYDAMMVHNPDGIAPEVADVAQLKEFLPLMLAGKGQIGYSKTLASAVAGNLGEGDQQDSTLGSWVTLTQRDWSGGRGEQAASTVGNRYADGLVDTQQAGRFTLLGFVYGPYALPSPPVAEVRFRPFIYGGSMYCFCGSNLYSAALTTDTAVNGEANINAVWTLVNSNAVYVGIRSMFIMRKNLPTINFTGGGVQVNRVIVSDAGVYFANDGSWTFGSSVASGGCGFSTGGNGHTSVINNTAKPFGYMVNPATGNPKPWEYLQQNNYGTTGVFYCQFGTAGTVAIGAVTYKGQGYVFANDGIYSITGYSEYGGTFTQVVDADIVGLSMPSASGFVWGVSPVDGKLYFNAGQYLCAFDGSGVTKSTLEFDVDLASDVSLMISGVCTSPEGIFVATGSSNKRSALFHVVNGAWHLVHVANNLTPIYSLWVDNRQVAGGSTVQARLWWFEGTQAYYIMIGTNRSNWVMASVGFNVRRRYRLSGEWVSSWWGGKYAATRKMFGGVNITHESWDVNASSAVQCDVQIDRSGVWIPLTLERVDWAQHVFVSTCKTWENKWVSEWLGSNQLRVNDVSNMAAGDFCRVADDVVQIKSISGDVLSLARALRGVIAVGETVQSARPVGYEARVRVRLSTIDTGLTPEITRVSLRMVYEMLRYDRYSVYVVCEDNMRCRDGTLYPFDAETLREKLRRWMNRPDPFWLVLPDGTRSIVRGMNGNDSEFKYQQVGVGLVAPSSVIKLVLQEVEDARG